MFFWKVCTLFLEEATIDAILTNLRSQPATAIQPTLYYPQFSSQNVSLLAVSLLIKLLLQIEMGRTAERCKFWPSCEKPETCPYHHPEHLCAMVNCK
jgi:hypothetical protein